jgi:phosphoribosylformylglycinamidine synthase
VLTAASSRHLITAAHDVSDAGVAQTLVEMATRAGVGADVDVPEGLDPFVFLLSESTARAVVTTTPAQAAALEELAAEQGVPVARIGEVTGSDELRVRSAYGETVAWTIAELRAAADAALPALFGQSFHE